MAAIGYSGRGAHGNDTFKRADSGTDHELDAEVARFLETEHFTSNGTDPSMPSLQPSDDKPGVLSANEDLVFMDFIESIDMPDLDFERDGEPPFKNVQMSDDIMSSSSEQPTITATIAMTEDLRPTSSLHVLIPASALATAPTKKSTLRRRRRSAKKVAPPHPKVKKERKRVKDEIEYLRQQVKALEEKLDELQQTPREEEAGFDSSSFGLCEGQLTDTMAQAAAWEDIAKRQELEKQKSKVENLQLRQMIKNQLGLAKGLSNHLRSQQDTAVCTQTRQLCVYAM